MELTPQSTRSPTPPFNFSGDSRPLFEYPSPAQSDSRYRPTDTVQGLGLYSCSMSGSPPPMDNQTASSESRGPHSVITNNWADITLQNHDTTRSPMSTPNILSADYDPFATYNSAVSAPFTTDIYTTSQTAEAPVLPASPFHSSNTSHRSSLSSAPPSEIFTQAGSVPSYTPRIKMEDHQEYAPSCDSFTIGSPHHGHTAFVSAANTYPGILEPSYYDQSPWGQKVEYTSTDLPPFSAPPFSTYDRRSESQDRSPSQDFRRPSVVARTRGPRKLTTKEDANYQCDVKGCGKLFSRSYNFKAHMETHEPDRAYSYPCTVDKCSKKFVRKTDLQRHNGSVHLKQRNHKCDYCSRFFARKDTLRRYAQIPFSIPTISPKLTTTIDTWKMGVLNASTSKPSILDLQITLQTTTRWTNSNYCFHHIQIRWDEIHLTSKTLIIRRSRTPLTRPTMLSLVLSRQSHLGHRILTEMIIWWQVQNIIIKSLCGTVD